MHCDIDIAVAGFLCPPSSVLNPGRWQPDYNPMQEKGAEVFYEVVECLRWYGVLGSIVKFVVLENVLGIFMRTRYNKKPPWYYFRKELKTVQTHVLLNVEKLSCHIAGVPMNGGRAIMIMVHKEVIGKSISHQALKERVSDSFRLIKCNPMQMQDLASVLGCRSIPASPPKRARRDLLPLELPPKALERTRKLRAQKGWPKVGTTAGHPFTLAVPELLLRKLSPRELDVLDCLVLHHNGKFEEGIVCDISQNADYKPWSRNNIPCLHKMSKLFYDGDIIPVQHHFKIMGFGDAMIPASLTATNIRRLAGNMISVPVIGAVFSVMLHHIKLAGDDD